MHVPRLLPGLLSLLFAAVPTQPASARDHVIVADTSGSLCWSVSGKGQPVSATNPARIAGAKNILADGTDSLSEYNSRRSLDDERDDARESELLDLVIILVLILTVGLLFAGLTVGHIRDGIARARKRRKKERHTYYRSRRRHS